MGNKIYSQGKNVTEYVQSPAKWPRNWWIPLA